MRHRIVLYAALCSVLTGVALLLVLWELGAMVWDVRGSRYVSWLPSFSVEVTRVRAEPLAEPPAASQLDAMARQVQQVFPQYSVSALVADLARTRSPDLTVDNILAGRLPARQHQPAPHPHPHPRPAAASPPRIHPGDEAEVGRARGGGTLGTVGAAQLHDDRAEPPPAGAQFSSSAAERESMLQRRKEQLIAAARRRYLQRDQLAATPHS